MIQSEKSELRKERNRQTLLKAKIASSWAPKNSGALPERDFSI